MRRMFKNRPELRTAVRQNSGDMISGSMWTHALARRIRLAVCETAPASTGPLGGADKIVEVDETVVGGRAENRAIREPAPKKAVVTLVEGGGRARWSP
jgi:hypothetical protein